MNKERKHFSKLDFLRAGMALSLLVLITYGISLASFKLKEGGRGGSVQTTVGTTVTAEITTNTSTKEDELLSEPYTELSEEPTLPFLVYPAMTNDSVVFGKEYDTKNAILINVDRNEIVAHKGERYRMYPASLTKVMTLIVAVENIDDLQDTVLITDKMVTPFR